MIQLIGHDLVQKCIHNLFGKNIINNLNHEKQQQTDNKLLQSLFYFRSLFYYIILLNWWQIVRGAILSRA